MIEKTISSLEDAKRLKDHLSKSKRDLILTRVNPSEVRIGVLARDLEEHGKGSCIVYAKNDNSSSPDSHEKYTVYIPLDKGKAGIHYVVYTSIPEGIINVA
jgi:hypothetical protein